MDKPIIPSTRAADVPLSSGQPDRVARWLLSVAGVLVVMVIVGGITRLTESGLSITHWKPLTGAVPPLNAAQWQAEFEAYQQIGEYQLVAGPAGMTLADYKLIYFWEWFHRLLGRFIGLIYALPLAWFWIKNAIPAGYTVRLLALLALGGLQGAFGWYMVRSGLTAEATDVSHFWLSVHLLTALFTLAGLVWTALDVKGLSAAAAPRPARPARLTGTALCVSAVLFIQLLLGAWVAGLNAGLASDSWPLMHGRLIPEFDLTQGLAWAISHDPFLLHFAHRWWAWVTAVGLILLARMVRPLDRRASRMIHAVLAIQIILGIATVWSGVDLWVAAAHQGAGALLVIATTWGLHLIGRKR